MPKIPRAYYRGADVLAIARGLLGRLLVTRLNGIQTSVRIAETEAYTGLTDRASHAWNGRRTARTEIMYADGGIAYVYLCYGIHHLFNVVTSTRNQPQVVLIRAGIAVEGVSEMLRRSGKTKADYSLASGPGNLSRALGIHTGLTGISLTGSQVFLADDGFNLPAGNIMSSPRIGVDYAGEDARLPYRFFIKDEPCVSGRKIKI